MNEAKSSSLSQELLDDFFAEADQHLLNIRNALQVLATSDREAPSAIGELFLEFHSFKGISAIAGLEPAEALAHATEDLLRLMQRGKVQPNDALLNALGKVTRKLEQIVAAFRAKKRLPDFKLELEEIKSQCSESVESDAIAGKEGSEPSSKTGKKSKPVGGINVFKVIFAPSRELNAKNINVNAIREELSRIGEILKSTPVVKGKGVIIFEFLIATKQALEESKEWEARGVTIELAEGLEGSSPSAAASQSAAEDTYNPFLAPSHFVRVDLKRLDDMLRIVGEMVIHRSRLEIELARVSGKNGHSDFRGVHEVNRMLGRSLRQMREDIMGIRLTPIGEIFARLPFVIQDLSRQSSKKVRLKLEGQETAVDKYLIEKLKDPLLHMVRNAFSHGIELAAERKAMGKPEEATIELSASTTGDFVVINVRDDGKGINANAVVQRAKRLGLEVPATTDSDTVLKILCTPGFSTREDADRTSGRGMGMSVVYSVIKELGGKLTLDSEEGRGTQFTLRLPLTVVIAETLLVSAAGQTCAVPQNSVREIFHATESEIRPADGIEMVSYRGGVLPIVRLAGLFHLNTSHTGVKCILVITSERGSVGLLVEKVLGQREVVVRTIRDPLIQVGGISGATEIGDGKPVLILDGVWLTAGKVRPPESLDFAQK